MNNRSRVSGGLTTDGSARAVQRVVNNFTAPYTSGGFADFPAKLGGNRASAGGAKQPPKFRLRGPQCWCDASNRVSAEFCAKQGSEFCTRSAKNRIRDNMSLSVPNDAGADHDRRGSRIRRFARRLTSITSAGRTGARLRTRSREGLLREARAGRSCPKAREQFRLSRPRKRVQRLSSRFGCSVCKVDLLIGRAS